MEPLQLGWPWAYAHAARPACEEYGTVAENFSRAALIWSAVLGHPVTREQVALCMIGLKLARLSYDDKAADGWVDVAGYAACGGEASKAE